MQPPPLVPPEHQLPLLMRNVDAVQPPDGLADKLARGTPLRVKLGLDPTAPSVTLGWAVVLRKLRHFQELGHTAVLIVGDFTAQVGDPSGRNETRRRLSADEVRGFAASVLDQFQRVLLPEPLEVRYNSEWLARLDMAEMLELTSKATVAQMLERGDFSTRFQDGTPISVMEFMYPLLQGYDSVAVHADVELGGSDQLWNLMMGRVIQERYGMDPQVAVTVPLLVGTDGEQKMSQSLGNYIGVEDRPEEMFGKTMSIPDHLMEQWFRLAADLDEAEVAARMEALHSGFRHPGDLKRELGRRLVEMYWDGDAAGRAEEAFDRVHRLHEIPVDVPGAALPPGDPVSLPAFLRSAGLVASAGEGRRLLQQGGVRVNGEAVSEVEISREALSGAVVQVGKRRFVRAE